MHTKLFRHLKLFDLMQLIRRLRELELLTALAQQSVDMEFIQFYDIMGASAGNVPLVKGTLVAYYVTGINGVPASAQQIAAAKNAGMGVITLDQWPGSDSWANGEADVLDYEDGAATLDDAIKGVKARSSKGWQSTIYLSFSQVENVKSALRSAGCDMSTVFFGVADYGWSLSDAQTQLQNNADWVYVQFGDPNSNPRTIIPGTNVTLSQANADIDVAKLSWAKQFLPAAA